MLSNCLKLSIIYLLSIGYVTPASAEKVYTWRDNEGNVHFGDKPNGANANEVFITPSSVGDSDGQSRFERNKILLDAYRADRIERENEREQQEKERQEKILKCQKAKQLHQQLTEAQFIYNENDQGEKSILDFEQRAQEENAAAEKVQRFCGKNG